MTKLLYLLQPMTPNLQNNKTFIEKVKSFFQSSSWKKALTFLFFLVIAFAFWLLQYLQQRFEIELSVPVLYENVPDEIVLTDNVPTQIKIKIADKGTVLFNYSLDRRVGPVKIDLNDIKPDKTSYSISRLALERAITKHLSATTTLLGYAPDKLVVEYDILKNKVVPVILNGKIAPASGFMFVDSVHINPASVLVYGSKSMLDTLQALYTEPLEITGLTKMLDKKVDLVIPSGMAADKKQVFLSGAVEGYTEKTLHIPVVCDNLPAHYILRLFPSSVEVSCQIALSKYSSLVDDSLKINLDYNLLVEDKKANVQLELSDKPVWLKHYRISPSNVEFLIEKK